MDWVLGCVLLHIVAQLGIAFRFSHRSRNEVDYLLAGYLACAPLASSLMSRRSSR